MTISTIIPTHNEAGTISNLVEHLKRIDSSHEVIVVDGGSSDDTRKKACEAGARCICSDMSRASQMNVGAKQACGDILYFIHADSIPPQSFIDDIKQAVKRGYEAGCYRLQFDSDHPLLKINAYMSRYDRPLCRGGDQSLFITRDLFERLGGYREDYMIMEDFEFLERVHTEAAFKVIPKQIRVSARKYKRNSYLKVQAANSIVYTMYTLGFSQQTMIKTYNSMLSLSKSWRLTNIKA